MTYKQHINDHDLFTREHAERFLRNHGTGIDNNGRAYLGLILRQYINPSVLDLACGTAVNHECWQRMGVPHQYTGFDLTRQFLAIAKEKYPDISLDHGYLQEVDKVYQQESFDVVVLRHVLEHLPQGNYQDVIKHALNIAKRELAIVFFLEPHSGSKDIIEERSSGIEGHPEVTHWWNTYSAQKLFDYLATLGVQIKTQVVHTPHAAHADHIIRLIK